MIINDFLKSALVEALEERRELVQEIEKGLGSKSVQSEDVFVIL